MGKSKVLVVDDNRENLKYIDRILNQNGFESILAGGRKEAMELITQSYPDLILLDLLMPELNGFDICEKLKADPHTNEIPVVFMTNRYDSDEIVKAYNAGGVDFLIKPVNENELPVRIRTHLELKHSRDLIKDQKEELDQIVEELYRSKEAISSDARKLLALNEKMAESEEILKKFNKKLEEKVKQRTEELEKANERLRKLDNARNYFLGLLSHELNTPLVGINGFAKLLKKNIAKEENIEYCDYIIESTERLKRYTEMSQLITSLQTGKYYLNRSRYHVYEIVESVISSIEEPAARKNIKFDILLEHPKTMIPIDYNLIHKVIEIIMGNSVKYSPENDLVTVKGFKNGRYYIYEFHDNGPGFSKDAQERMFEFFSSDELMHHTEGMGLGLAAARFIMDGHSGRIEAGNNSGGGAMIRLSFRRD